MKTLYETTIKNTVHMVGIGLHSGKSIEMDLEPSNTGGIIFYRSDKDNTPIKLEASNVCRTDLATTICNGDIHISTIEHLLSAIYSYGIDNIKIYVSDMEIPIADGSALEFCNLLDKAGIKYLKSKKNILKITKEIIIQDKQRFTKITPSDELSFDYEINFNHKSIGRLKHNFIFSKEAYIQDISKARTFGFLKDLEYMQSRGLAKGASMSNAIALDDNKILNMEPLRYKNEFVRHKILDAIGDMSVLGMPVLGAYSSYSGSHSLNFALVKEVLNQSAYEIIQT